MKKEETKEKLLSFLSNRTGRSVAQTRLLLDLVNGKFIELFRLESYLDKNKKHPTPLTRSELPNYQLHSYKPFMRDVAITAEEVRNMVQHCEDINTQHPAYIKGYREQMYRLIGIKSIEWYSKPEVAFAEEIKTIVSKGGTVERATKSIIKEYEWGVEYAKMEYRRRYSANLELLSSI